MENNQSAAAATPESKNLVDESHSQELFTSSFKSFDINASLMDGMSFDDKEFLDLITQVSMESHNDPSKAGDLMQVEDNKYVEKLKEIIYTICQDLPEFNSLLQYTPVIIGSNAVFQQTFEHIPLHCYEHVPLVFTLVIHTGEYSPPTYFADARGGVQTGRDYAAQNLVGCYFQIKGRIGEIYVTPGYLMRYTETNLDKQTYATLNVKIGFGR
jgi:hypothetical protein